MTKGSVKKINMLAGLAVSAVFIYFAFRNIEFRHILYNISHIRLIWLPFIVLLSLCTIFLRSFRSVYFFRPFGRVGAAKVFYIFCAGALANNVMPFRLGEVARAYISGRVIGVSKSTSLGIIFLERVFDGVMFLLLLIFVSSFIPAIPQGLKPLIMVSGVVFFGLFISILAFSRNLERLNGFFEKFMVKEGLVKKIAGLAVKFTHGLSCVSDKKLLIRITALSFIAWFLEGVNYYLMARAFSMNINVFQGVFIMLVTGLGIMLPSSPGFVGTYEVACTTAIVILGFGKTLGLSYALLLHFMQIAEVAVLGVVSILSLGMKLGDLSRGADEAQETGPDPVSCPPKRLF